MMCKAIPKCRWILLYNSFNAFVTGNLQGLQIFEEPRCLVFYNPEKSEFEINEEALNDMKIIKHDVESIAIVGPYRTGKSYLLNRLAGKYAGTFLFHIRNSIFSTTMVDEWAFSVVQE